MKSVYILVLFCLATLSEALAQTCLSYEMHVENMKDPAYRAAQAKLEAETQQYLLDKAVQDTTTLIIPIVFHVIHNGGPENISAAQIRNQVATLNVEFKRLQSDTTLTPTPFKALGGRFNVEFRLATIDPNGKCTNGITRTYSPISACSEIGNDVKSLIYWPSNKYLNIWLVTTMRYSIGAACNGGGYAQFPGGLATTDGVEIRADLIGSIGTAASNPSFGNWKGRYLIHELGHWFNLRHIWGDATCGNDQVADTPPAQASNSGCPVFPQRPNNSCGSDQNGEMTSNYMDYSTGACLNIFTKQQVTRMEAAINGSASSRNNLWKPANLILTGTNTTSLPNCLAVPEMKPYGTKIICNSGTVAFTDVSYGGTKTSRHWSFPGGTTTGNPSDSIINITYAMPGTYQVSLMVKKGVDSTTVSYAGKVVVISSTADPEHTAPVEEGFSSDTLNQWIALNPDGDEGFKRSSLTGADEAGCVVLNNFHNKPGRLDDLISPAYNLSGLLNATLTYKIAFAKKTSTSRDKLEVYLSTNCGQNWTKRSTKIANDATNKLETVTTNQTSAFVPPTGSTQWRLETVTLNSTYMVNGFRMKFTLTGSSGNNLYIDDIRINGTPVVGTLDALEEISDIEIYPNPTDGELKIRLPKSIQDGVELLVMDVCGKVQKQMDLNSGKSENQESLVNLEGLKPGIYFCALKRHGILVSVKKIQVE